MAYCKKFIVLFLILFILFSFNYCFASENENVEINDIYGLVASENSNIFTANSNQNLKTFQAEPGYIYTIEVLQNFSVSRIVVTSSALPVLNGSYDILFNNLMNAGDEYTFVVNSPQYISISVNYPDGYINVYRNKIDDMDSSITNLVENVGPNALWGVFGSGIDFVFIIVIVAFGLFIIYKLIKGFSKGKSKI